MKTLTAILAAVLLGLASARAHEKHEHPPGPGLFGQPPEYIHVLLNPLPVYGMALGAVALAAALLARNQAAQNIGLAIIIIVSASAWPVQHYGQNAYERVRQITGEQGQLWLDQHMGRADKLIYAFYATALLGIGALVSRKKFPRTATGLTIAALLASGVSLGVGGWISKAGGQIRHPEFRTGSASSTEAAPHQHGTSEPALETTQHEKIQPSDATNGQKHAAMPEPASIKVPLPDTLEGTWKAIHEHQGELESAVTGKKFSDVEPHAQLLSELLKRLVELSHGDHKPAVESGVNKVNQALAELKQSAETGSELVLKNYSDAFAKSLDELEQQMKKQ